MRLYRLYCPALDTAAAPGTGSLVLSKEEAHHAVVSLRAKPGHEVVLFDGAGREASGQITRIQGRQVYVQVGEITRYPFDVAYKVTLAAAMTKAHRQGYLVEKCTELGVASFWPIIADHSVVRPSEAAVDKWFRRAIEAAKQSHRRWVPTVAETQTVAQALARVGEFDASALTQPAPPPPAGPSSPPFNVFLSRQRLGASLLVWVGPEGGWSENERAAITRSGATATSLGPTTLRSETAAVAVCAAVAMVSTKVRSP